MALSVKVSAKGAVSIYGLQRFPVTLYAEQWAQVFEKAPAIQEFIKANVAQLAIKQAANNPLSDGRAAL